MQVAMKKNTLKRQIALSVEDLYSCAVENREFQADFQTSRGGKQVVVSEWLWEGGPYPKWGQEHSNPVATANYEAKRIVTFQTPLKLPAMLKSMIGASVTNATVEQYLVYDRTARHLRMWTDVTPSGEGSVSGQQ